MRVKFYFLFLFLFCLTIKNSNSQGFTYTNLGPVYVQYPYIPDSVQVVQRRAIVRNNLTVPLNFKFARIVNNMPNAGWYTQMCYDLCYAPHIDTISLPGDPPYTIQPNHQDTLFYIDFTCDGEGLGTSIVRMYNTDNPSQYVQDTFKVQIGNVGVTNISSLVEDYKLSQNYPNPFNPSTNIKFSIPNSEVVTLKIYDILGNEVAAIINNEKLTAGEYKVDFDSRLNGNSLSSGIYYYTIRTENFVQTKKMMLVK